MSIEKKIYRIDEFLENHSCLYQHAKTSNKNQMQQSDAALIAQMNQHLQDIEILSLDRDRKKIYALKKCTTSFQNSLRSVLKSMIIEYFGTSASQWTISWVQSRYHKDRGL